MAVEMCNFDRGVLGRLLPAPFLQISDEPDIDEVFQWARFLDHGQGFCLSRQRAVLALLEAVGNDRDVLFATRLFALRALRQGVASRGVTELLQAAIDRLDDDRVEHLAGA